MSRHVVAAEIAAALTHRVEHLVREILPNARRDRHEMRVGSVAGEPGSSLAVRITGHNRGRWTDAANPEHHGDPLDLIAHVAFGGDLRGALNWARCWLGMDRSALPPIPTPAPVHVEDDTQEKRRNIDLAQRLWRETVNPEGTPVETYIRFRGLNLPYSGVLRFHPACPCGRERLPTMIAKMTDQQTGEFAGIHRTFLRPDGCGKADTLKPKMMLGSCGVIEITPAEEISYCVGICEGIETALAIEQRLGFRAIWATGSAGGIERFPLLHPVVSSLWIFTDQDDGGTSERAAAVCASRWSGDGREVTIAHAPSGHDFASASCERAA